MKTCMSLRGIKILGSVLLFLGFFFLAWVYFLKFMQAPLFHDEEHYVSAGILIGQNVLYRDLAFFQMPYLPLLYRGVSLLFQEGFFLMQARILTCFLWIISLVALFALFRRSSGSRMSAAAVVFLAAVSGVALESVGWADNNIPAMAFFSLGLYFFVRGDEGRRPYGSFALAGAAFGFAMCLKLFYLLFLFPVLLYFWAAFRAREAYKEKASCFLAGLLVAVLPMLFMAAFWPQPFFFGNWTYHKLTALWWAERGEGVMVHWRTSLHLLKRTFLFKGSNLCLLCAALVPFVFSLRREHIRRPIFIFIAALPVVGFLVLLLPRPLFVQHLLLLLPLLVALSAESMRALSPFQKKHIRIFFLGLCLVSWGWGGHALLAPLTAHQPWTGVTLAATAQRLRAVLPASSGKIATLAPLLALESGLPIYSELSTGPFLYRLGDSPGRPLPWTFGGARPIDLMALFRHDPPQAVLVGFEGDLDRVFEKYAVVNGYQQHPGNWMGGRLYIYANRNFGRRDFRAVQRIAD